jgi:hypothetical protein
MERVVIVLFCRKVHPSGKPPERAITTRRSKGANQILSEPTKRIARAPKAADINYVP